VISEKVNSDKLPPYCVQLTKSQRECSLPSRLVGEERVVLARVFLGCSDAFCETLRNALQSQGGFVVCGETANGVELIKATMELLPDLVIVEMELPPLDGFEVADALKLIMPNLPVFLLTEQYSSRAEKEALSVGIDAVFDKAHDLKALVMNARAVCGLD
jgi:DNA-binding NarL/FixJ family response regulator